MPEHILFLTGRLAERRLANMLGALQPSEFSYDVIDIGVKVAALMTADIIRRRLPRPLKADRVILPGRFRGDLEALGAGYGVPFQRGPDDLKDLAEFFGRKGSPPDLSRHDVRIFAEIVEAPNLDIAGILDRAEAYRRQGADIIDLGCLPDTPFPHLEEAIAALIECGFEVSVDSADVAELRRGAKAGARYLLSLTERTVDLAEETDATPVLIPAKHGDVDSLIRAMDKLERRRHPYIADPIIDPIHFGFTESLGRYAELRRRRPKAPILMGIGNLTELTDADTTGITAILMGIVSELAITNVLVVQVSPHCRRAVAEANWARRIMFAARESGSLPMGIDPALLALRDRKPFADTPAEIAELAAMISDDNYRIAAAEDGIHIYNRQGHRVGPDPFALFPYLGVERDGGHAFYLGVETAKAEIAWRLGKRYVQDQPLGWGSAVERPEEDAERHAAPGTTLARRRKRQAAS
jgi:dihydropteroate synthase-like protein